VQLKYDALMFPSGDAVALADCLRGLYSDKKVQNINYSLVQERRKKFEFDWDAKVVEILKKGAKV
jgi:hypothetical protein